MSTFPSSPNTAPVAVATRTVMPVYATVGHEVSPNRTDRMPDVASCAEVKIGGDVAEKNFGKLNDAAAELAAAAREH